MEQKKKKRVSKVPNPLFEPNWTSSATAENAALASVSLEEKHNPQRLLQATHALTTSPMFVLLCRDFAKEQTADGRQRGSKRLSAEQLEFEVRLFAARMYLAGLRSRRSK